MGTASSKSGKPSKKSSASRRGSQDRTKAHWNYESSKPAPPSYLNVNRALGAAVASNNHTGQRRSHPVAQPVGTPRNIVHQQTNPKPVVLMTTKQQNNRPRAQRNQPRSTNGAAVKPKVDYRNIECGVCGHTGHSAERCHHRHNSCYICNQPGHLASICSQKIHHTNSRYKPRNVEL